MEFYDYITNYQIFGKGDREHTPDEFYRTLLKEFVLDISNSKLEKDQRYHDVCCTFNQLEAENTWFHLNNPYYKIYPNILNMFLNTRIQIPVQYFRTPFPSMLIRLPKDHNISELMTDGQCLRSVLVSTNDPENILDLVSGKTAEHKQCILWFDFGEKEPNGNVPVYTYQTLRCIEGRTIEECLTGEQNERYQDSIGHGIKINEEVITNALKVVVSVCFLATGTDKIVEPDILNKDFAKYLEYKKNNKSVDLLHEKAKKRGKYGWNIGRESNIFSRHEENSESSSEESEKHLQYQHQRQSHFHIVKYGPNKSLSKVEWYRQITVRPDLPSPPVDKVKSYKAKEMNEHISSI